MKQKYKKYKLKKSDSISLIAKQFKKSAQELRDFHNIFCLNDESIILDFPKGLKFLYVYPYLDLNEVRKKPKVKFEFGQSLKLNPKEDLNCFSVCYIFSEGTNVINMKFEMSVRFLKKVNEKFLFEINRISNVFINDEQANLIHDELAEKCSEVFYPLQIYTNAKGRWTEIANHQEIVERWQKSKAEILQYYYGEWAEQYIKEHESSLIDENVLTRLLKKDFFLYSFFNEIYINYTPVYEVVKEIKFPVISNCSEVLYHNKQKIRQYLDKNSQVVISQIGKYSDSRGITDLKEGNQFPYYSIINKKNEKTSGEYYSKYYLNQENQIENIYLKCNVDLDEMKQVEIMISKL